MKDEMKKLMLLSLLLSGCSTTNDEDLAKKLFVESKKAYYSGNSIKGNYKAKIEEYEKSFIFINKIQEDYPETKVAASVELFEFDQLVTEGMTRAAKLYLKGHTPIKNPLYVGSR